MSAKQHRLSKQLFGAYEYAEIRPASRDLHDGMLIRHVAAAVLQANDTRHLHESANRLDTEADLRSKLGK